MFRIAFILLLILPFCLVSAKGQWNGNSMENWQTYSLSGVVFESCEGWEGMDSIFCLQSIGCEQQLYKTNDAHSGNFAAVLESKIYPNLGQVIGGVLTSRGLSINWRVDSVSAWVKYTPVNNDSGRMEVLAISDSGIINLNEFIIFGAQASYTKITIPIVYKNATDVPKNLVISFSSGIKQQAGSVLIVDDIYVPGSVSKSSEHHLVSPFFHVYPNPTSNTLTIITESMDELSLQLYSLLGTKILQKEFSKRTSIDVASFPPGIYVYKILHGKDGVVYTGKAYVE